MMLALRVPGGRLAHVIAALVGLYMMPATGATEAGATEAATFSGALARGWSSLAPGLHPIYRGRLGAG